MPRLSITLTESQAATLDRIAAETGATKQSMIGLAVSAWIRANDYLPAQPAQTPDITSQAVACTQDEPPADVSESELIRRMEDIRDGAQESDIRYELEAIKMLADACGGLRQALAVIESYGASLANRPLTSDMQKRVNLINIVSPLIYEQIAVEAMKSHGWTMDLMNGWQAASDSDETKCEICGQPAVGGCIGPDGQHTYCEGHRWMFEDEDC